MILMVGLVPMLGCSQAGYYTQAIKGQWEILRARQPVAAVLTEPTLPPARKAQLELATALRDFATMQLALPDNRTYRTYGELARDYAVWNVVATAEFETALKTWCFPFAGCVAYKGFFARNAAKAWRAQLQQQGYDTYLYGVAAYSTLGWFADPLLDTFIDYPEFSLAHLIFHELAHQVVYVKDDSLFNEAFAEAVARAGVDCWAAARHDSMTVTKLHARRARTDANADWLLHYREKLRQLYARTAADATPRVARRQQKQQFFTAMRAAYRQRQADGDGSAWYDRPLPQAFNNAHLANIATYHSHLPAFQRALKQAPSLAAFYATIRAVAARPKSARAQWLQARGPVMPPMTAARVCP